MGPGIRPHPASLLPHHHHQLRALYLSSSCFPAALLAASCRRAGLTAHAPDALRCHSHPLGSGCWALGSSSVCCARAERAPHPHPPPLSVATLKPGCFPRALPESPSSGGRSQTAPPLERGGAATHLPTHLPNFTPIPGRQVGS